MPTTRKHAGLDWDIVRPEDHLGGGGPLIQFLRPFWLRARIPMFEIDGDAFLAVEFAYQKLATRQSLSIADLDNAVEEVYNIHRYKSPDGGPAIQWVNSEKIAATDRADTVKAIRKFWGERRAVEDGEGGSE